MEKMEVLYNGKLNIDYFQSSAPRVGTLLHLSNQKSEFFAVSKKILIKEQQSESLKKIIQHFDSIWTISSPIKHLEIELIGTELEWNAFYLKLKSSYEQIVWLDVQMENTGKDKSIYYFDFIPLARKEGVFPLETNLKKCLEQKVGSQQDVLVIFLTHLKKLSSPYLSIKKVADKSSSFSIKQETCMPDINILDTGFRVARRPRMDNSTIFEAVNLAYVDSCCEEKAKRSNNWIKRTLFCVCLIVIVSEGIALARPKVSFKAEIDGDSMFPTYYDTEKVVVVKSVKEIHRFDVVVFNHSKEERYIKRVIGLPGEKINYKDGELYVNDELVEDPYHVGNENFTLYEVAEVNSIPLDYYLVLGDNRNNSSDSRSYGLISSSSLIGTLKEE